MFARDVAFHWPFSYKMQKLDLWLFRWLNADADSPVWFIDAVALYSEHMPTVVIASMLLCLAVGSPRLRQGMAYCLVAMLVAWCCTRLIRWGFPLERPYDMGLGKAWISHGSRPRFPSLHATVAFAFAYGVTLWCAWGRWGLLAKVLAWGAALFIGWSRVYVGVHLPLDIVAGLVVGMFSAWLVQRFSPQLAALGRSAAYWCRRAVPWVRRR